MNAESCLMPSYDRIIDDPELAALAVLDAALVASRNSLQAHLPELGDPSPCREVGLPEPETLLAAFILERVSELRDLLSHYRQFSDARRNAIRPWSRDQDDDIF